MMLPNGWKKVKLGDCFDVQLGKMLNKNAREQEPQYPYVANVNVRWGLLNTEQLPTMYFSEREKEKFALRKNDILMCEGGEIGRCAVLKQSLDNVFYQKACHRLRAKNDLCTPDYLYFYINHYVSSREIVGLVGESSIAHLPAEKVIQIPLNLPPIEEQKKIAATLSVWDSAIEKMEKLIKAKENSYDCFLAISIMSDTYAELGTFLTEVSERNKDENIQQVLSVSNSKGFVLPEEQFDRKVASENLSNYKIVRLGQYAYNPSRINVGSIARLNDWKEAVISPMYTVFEIGDQKQLDSDFLLHWLNSSEAKQRIKNSAQGSVRETVGFGDLCKIKIPKFTLKRQQKIVSVLNSMNQEITLLMQQLENYKKQKQGLMQKLLTGQWRVK